jgi:arylsulfatase A-like enzyme
MKLSLYEGGIRLPLLARWPGHIPAGYVDEKSVIAGVDVYLTLCKLAGVPLPDVASKESDGEDRSPVLLGKLASREKALFWEYGRKQVGYGYPRLPSDRSPNVATREGDWKLIINDNGTSTELYNIVADPKETKNVADEHKDIAQKLSASALAWRKTLPGRSADQDTTLSAKPNILLILADDMGYNDISIQGAKDIPTPNIDSIGRAGMRFTNGYVSCPICGPTRAGLLTGRYQQRFGFETNNGPEIIAVPEYGVQRDQKMLSEYLKEVGYTTGMFGKWHLGFRPELTPPQRGFDTFFGFTSGYHGYYPDKPAPHSGPIVRGNTPVEEKEYLTTALGREASKFIQDNARRPFFIYLPFNAVHSPMQAPKEIEDELTSITRPRRRTLSAMTIAMDRAVGRVLNTLRENSLEDNTLVIFLSDNGSPFETDPLRGKKGMCYEGGIRIPFMVQWKGHIAGGRTVDTPVSSLDILPTVMAAAKAPLPTNGIFDGKNILGSLIEDDPFPARTLYWRFYDGKKSRAIREGDWKLLSEGGPWELYNLANDIGETSNTATEKPELVHQLEAKWNTWNSQMIDPKWHGQPPPKTPDPAQQAVTTGTTNLE